MPNTSFVGARRHAADRVAPVRVGHRDVGVGMHCRGRRDFADSLWLAPPVIPTPLPVVSQDACPAASIAGRDADGLVRRDVPRLEARVFSRARATPPPIRPQGNTAMRPAAAATGFPSGVANARRVAFGEDYVGAPGSAFRARSAARGRAGSSSIGWRVRGTCSWCRACGRSRWPVTWPALKPAVTARRTCPSGDGPVSSRRHTICRVPYDMTQDDPSQVALAIGTLVPTSWPPPGGCRVCGSPGSGCPRRNPETPRVQGPPQLRQEMGPQGLGDVILETRNEPSRRRTRKPPVTTSRCCHDYSRDD